MSYLTDHAEDLFARSAYTPEATAFLSPAEQREIFDELGAARERLIFWGGAIGAQRRCAFFVPDWMLLQDEGTSPSLASLGAFSDEREARGAALDTDGSLSGGRIAVVRIKGSGFAALGHRDYMGAILNLGIKRAMLGDIVVRDGNECEAYCTGAAARVISSELDRIGRDAVKVSVRAVSPGERIERRYEESTVTVASLRLDCVVRELARVSRETAQRLIASGAVELDYKEETDTDTRVTTGSTVSVRGAGKFLLGEVEGVTRKDRIRVRVYKYV